MTFSDDPKHPEIEVQLTGTDGNAGAVMGRVSRALRDGGVPTEEIDEFRRECMSGNYEELLQTCMRWVDVR